MKQSRLMSLVESVANVIVGYGVAVVTQILIFPLFGLNTTLAQNLKMGAVFTVVSIARSFALRRRGTAYEQSHRSGQSSGKVRTMAVGWPRPDIVAPMIAGSVH